MRLPGVRMGSAKRWRKREYVGRPGLSPVVAGLVAGGVLSPGLDLLDLGCGRGADALPLAALGFRVTGVDANPRSVTAARRAASRHGLTKRAAFHEADVAKGLPFPDRAFDVVLDTLLYNNLDDDEVDRYAAEAARVLRRRGLLVLQHKVERHKATWHPHGTPRELERLFDFGLPVHTHLAEGGHGQRKGYASVAVVVGKKRG